MRSALDRAAGSLQETSTRERKGKTDAACEMTRQWGPGRHTHMISLGLLTQTSCQHLQRLSPARSRWRKGLRCRHGSYAARAPRAGEGSAFERQARGAWGRGLWMRSRRDISLWTNAAYIWPTKLKALRSRGLLLVTSSEYKTETSSSESGVWAGTTQIGLLHEQFWADADGCSRATGGGRPTAFTSWRNRRVK